jgi:hypothetical protein
VSLSVAVVDLIEIVVRIEQMANTDDGASRADRRRHGNALRNVNNGSEVSPSSESGINDNVASVASKHGE